ncbi:MAG: hypothetical protein IPG34_19555 [Rhodocyclaceae bacterium]|nr:hypothetical protein [Rhodocyclaceae bacterium]
MAGAFNAWLDPLAKIGDALMSLRHALGAGNPEHSIGLAVSYMRLIGERTWISFRDALGNTDSKFYLDISTSVAGTLGAWVDLLTKFDALSLALRRVRTDGLSDSGKLETIWSTLTWLAGKSWTSFVSGAMAGGVDMQTVSQAVAATLGAWVDLASKMGDLSRSLLRVREVPETVFVTIDGVFARLWATMDSFYGKVKDDPDPANRPTVMAVIAGSLSTMVDSAARVADLSRSLIGYVKPLPTEWANIKDAMTTVWDQFSGLAKTAIADPIHWEEEVAPRIKAWRETVQALAGAVGSVAGIQLQTYVKPLETEFMGVKESMAALWGMFKEIATNSMPKDVDDADEMSKRIGAWSAIVQALVGAISATAGLNVIEHIGIAPSTMTKIKTTILSLFSTFEDIASFWAAGHRRPDLQSASIQQWSQTVSSILGAVSGTFALLKDTTGVMPSQMSSTMINRLRNTMVAFLVNFEELWTGEEWSRFAFQDGERGIADRDRHHGSIRTFADAVGGAMGAVKSTIDTLVAFTDNAGKLGQVSVTAQSAISGAITILFSMFEGMAHQWRAGTIVGDLNLAAVKTFADSVNSIFAPIKGVIDTLSSIDELMWETLDAGNDADTSARLGRRVAGGRGSVTASGKFRFPRVIQVTKDNISYLTGFVNVMFSELKGAMETLRAAFAKSNPGADWAVYLAELKAFLETVGSGMGVFKSINELITGLMDNPLSVMSFGGRAGNQRGVSKWWTQVRTNRAEHQADLLKEAIKRNIRVIVDAVKEAFSGENEMPDMEQINLMERLAAVLSGLITAVGSIALTPDLDKAKVDALVSVMRQLSEITMPAWLQAGGLSGESVAAFRALLDALTSAESASIDAVVNAVSRLTREATAAALGGLFVTIDKGGTITIGGGGSRPIIEPPGIEPPGGTNPLSIPGGDENGIIDLINAFAGLLSIPGVGSNSLPGGEEGRVGPIPNSLPGGEEGRVGPIPNSLPGGEEGRVGPIPNGLPDVGPIPNGLPDVINAFAGLLSIPGGDENGIIDLINAFAGLLSIPGAGQQPSWRRTRAGRAYPQQPSWRRRRAGRAYPEQPSWRRRRAGRAYPETACPTLLAPSPASSPSPVATRTACPASLTPSPASSPSPVATRTACPASLTPSPASSPSPVATRTASSISSTPSPASSPSLAWATTSCPSGIAMASGQSLPIPCCLPSRASICHPSKDSRIHWFRPSRASGRMSRWTSR